MSHDPDQGRSSLIPYIIWNHANGGVREAAETESL